MQKQRKAREIPLKKPSSQDPDPIFLTEVQANPILTEYYHVK